MDHSVQFNKYYERYQRSGCTKEQLRRLTELEALTDAEYKIITGEDYTVMSQ